MAGQKRRAFYHIKYYTSFQLGSQKRKKKKLQPISHIFIIYILKKKKTIGYGSKNKYPRLIALNQEAMGVLQYRISSFTKFNKIYIISNIHKIKVNYTSIKRKKKKKKNSGSTTTNHIRRPTSMSQHDKSGYGCPGWLTNTIILKRHILTTFTSAFVVTKHNQTCPI